MPLAESAEGSKALTKKSKDSQPEQTKAAKIEYFKLFPIPLDRQ